MSEHPAHENAPRAREEGKVLVVDDEQDVEWLFRQRFRREMRRGELDFAFAVSGKEALRYLRKGGTALVLSDINMPGMTGLELLKEIKKQHPALDVVMITAYGDERNHQEALRCGAADYFTKPIDFEALKEKVITPRSPG